MTDLMLGGFIHFHQLLSIACESAAQARQRVAGERDFVNNTPLIAVAFAAAACETCLNEIAMAARLARTTESLAFYELMEELEHSRVGIKAKFMLAKRLLTGSSYKKGEQPFQNFALLENARNQLVHGKLSGAQFTRDHDGLLVEKEADLLTQMRSLNVLADFPNDPNIVAGTLVRLSTPAVAAWAHNSAYMIIEDLMNSVPKDWGVVMHGVWASNQLFGAAPIRDVRVADVASIKCID
jgi:hypothetical protein